MNSDVARIRKHCWDAVIALDKTIENCDDLTERGLINGLGEKRNVYWEIARWIDQTFKEADDER